MGGEKEPFFSATGSYQGRNKCAGQEMGVAQGAKFGTKKTGSTSSVPKGKKVSQLPKKIG